MKMKHLIRNTIDFLERGIFNLKKAYDDTWGGEDLGEEFADELEQRKEENKEKFISFVAGIYTFEAMRKGIMLHEDIARDLATNKFNEEVGKGTFDELNNIKEKK
jgi:hypothetical protein